MKLNIKFWILYAMVLYTGTSCKKFITVAAPKTQLVSSSVFQTDQSAESAMIGIYSIMMESSTGPFSGGSSSIGPLCGMAADELKNYSTKPDPGQIYQNAISPSNTLVGSVWAKAYQYIFAVNSALEGMGHSNHLSEKTRKRLTGEAKFLRAFYYFYLVNLFDSIPLITTTDYLSNASQVRAPRIKIDELISQDLQDAEQALSESADQAGSVRPGLSAVHFLQARYFLFQRDWTNALKAANEVLNISSYSLCSDLDQVFLKESPETIWQLMPVAPGANTWDGFYYILLSSPSNVALSAALLSTFEPGDMRRIKWVDSVSDNGTDYFFPDKYKLKRGVDLLEYQVVFRLSEMVLVRAEALAEMGDLPNADADLNLIRSRAGLLPVSSADLQAFLNYLMHERQVELFTEWGNRWFDLKRTGLADSILSNLKGTDWQTTDILFPIPQAEIQSDPNLTQNAGY